jgi:hypothetical protein
MEKPELNEWMVAVQTDVERLWQTLQFNSETIKLLDTWPDPREEGPQTKGGCSDATVCTSCSSGSCIMTVYHD